MSEMNEPRRSELGARRSEDLLSAIDSELKAALAIEPSGDFEARVRRAIDADASAPRWRWMPSFAFVAAAAAVVITTTLAIVMLRPTGEMAPQQAGRDVELKPGSAADAPAVAPRASSDKPNAGRRPPASALPAAARKPEIIVPLNQMEALRRLVDALEKGRVALVDVPDGPVAPPAELVVEPLVVEPLLPPIDPADKGSTPEIRRPQ